MVLRTRKLLIIIPYAVIILYSLYALIPFLWMIATSLKPVSEICVWPPNWIPRPFLWDN